METKLRAAYKKVRHELGLTIGDAARALDVSAVFISELENGKQKPIELESFKAEVQCHHCHDMFIRRPVKGASFVSYVCPDCKGKEDGSR